MPTATAKRSRKSTPIHPLAAGMFDGLIIDDPSKETDSSQRRTLRPDGRFVSGERVSPATEFKPGQRISPATEFKSGQRSSPQTEFKPGQPARNKLPVGSVTIRVQKRTGSPRAWVKLAEPSVWKPRAAVVWEKTNGPIPRGSVVHHKDRNTVNDDIGNLELKSRADHIREHREEMEPLRIEAKRRQRRKPARTA